MNSLKLLNNLLSDTERCIRDDIDTLKELRDESLSDKSRINYSLEIIRLEGKLEAIHDVEHWLICKEGDTVE